MHGPKLHLASTVIEYFYLHSFGDEILGAPNTTAINTDAIAAEHLIKKIQNRSKQIIPLK